MLTKTDLTQIRKVMREEIANESESIRDDITGEVKMAMVRIIERVDRVENRLKNVEIKTNGTQNDVKKLQDKVAKMHKDLLKSIEKGVLYSDKMTIEVEKRVKRIEDQLEMVTN